MTQSEFTEMLNEARLMATRGYPHRRACVVPIMKNGKFYEFVLGRVEIIMGDKRIID